jgi:GH24 family phage-related lysozyme (muramidase)
LSRKISQAGISIIKAFEGCRLTAYKPVTTEPHYTIGWGHYGPDIKAGMTITQAQADSMLIADLAKYEAYVNNPSYVSVTDKLTQNQYDAMVSFCYNCGAGNLQRLCKGRTVAEIAQHLTAYNKSNGSALPGLTRRRQAELELFNRQETATEVDEMTAIQYAELLEKVSTLASKCESQEDRIRELEERDNMACPSWAADAVAAAVKSKLIDTPKSGNYTFYRFITILHRLGLY